MNITPLHAGIQRLDRSLRWRNSRRLRTSGARCWSRRFCVTADWRGGRRIDWLPGSDLSRKSAGVESASSSVCLADCARLGPTKHPNAVAPLLGV